jgi:hypothetical protein
MIYADRLNIQTDRHFDTQIDGQTVGGTDRWRDRQMLEHSKNYGVNTINRQWVYTPNKFLPKGRKDR